MKLGDAEKQPLYHLYQKEEEEKTKLKLIPYYMWNNRGEGEMQYGSAHVNDFIKEEIKDSGKGMAPDAASPFFRSSCYAKI